MKLTILTLTLLLTTVLVQGSDDFTGVEAESFHANQLLQNHAKFGVQYVIEQAHKAKDLASSNYAISQVNSVYQQQNEGMMYYTFDLSLVDSNQNTIRAVFSVSYVESSKTQTVTSYAYDTSKTLNDLVIGAQASSPTQASSSSDGSLSKILFVESPTLEWTGNAWPGQDSNENANGERVLGGRRRLSLEAFNNSPKVQRLFIFGLENVLGLVMPENLAGTQFKLTEILSITQQTVGGMNYNFDVEVRNGDGVTMKVNFKIFDQVWEATQRISSYNFSIKEDKPVDGASPIEL